MPYFTACLAALLGAVVSVVFFLPLPFVVKRKGGRFDASLESIILGVCFSIVLVFQAGAYTCPLLSST